MYNYGLNREFNRKFNKMTKIYLVHKLVPEGADVIKTSTNKFDAHLYAGRQAEPKDWYVVSLDVTPEVAAKAECLWVVYFESSNYCGYGERCMVWATSEEDARDKAADYADNFYFEQDEEQYMEEHGDDTDGVMWADIKTVDALDSDECKDIQKWLLDATQRSFYPIIN